MPEPPLVRRASADDRAPVLKTVAAAFASDPGWDFILAAEYERLVEHFVGALFDVRIRTDHVWVTSDLASVAMWDAPDKSGFDRDYAERIWEGYRAIAGRLATQRLSSYNEAVAAVAPSEPHWYLGVLATIPVRQRRGLATAVLTPVLDEADRCETSCCLETSTEQNRRFYERRGFTRATDVQLPFGPPTWWLERPARSTLPSVTSE
jgi:GNAT superfamily N-acetyltransferase